MTFTRDTLIQLLGKLPTRSELVVQTLEEVDCGLFVRRKIIFTVETDEWIEAYLCVPTNASGPLPAVYCFHQHAGNRLLGKSEVVGLAGDPEQAYGKELAERGYVTIAPDAICFESRVHSAQPEMEHVTQLFNRLLLGGTLLGKVLFDMEAGIDLLAALPEVDANRIGFIGHSYGGRLALFAPVFDRRIKASISSCGSTSFKRMMALKTGIQLDFVVPGLLESGDLVDIVRLVDPASLLILGADDDRWSDGVEALAEAAQDAFKHGTLEHHLFEGTHGFPKSIRALAYSFLDKYLFAL